MTRTIPPPIVPGMRRALALLVSLLVASVALAAIAAPAQARKKRPRQPRPAASAQAAIPSSIPGCANLASDMGRPVCEIANELGVPAAVFREAFSHVTPAARGTEPSDAQREANHRILLSALTPYGVTPATLDAVSDRYRL